MECSFWLSDFKRAQISSSFLHTPTPEDATPRPEGRRDHALAGMPPCSRSLLFFNVINTRGSLPFRGQTLIATNFPAAGLPLPLPPAPGGSCQAASGQAAVASEHGSCGWDSTATANPLRPFETIPNHCIHPPRAPRRKWHHDFHFTPFLTDQRKTTRPKTIIRVSDVSGWTGRSGMLSSDLEETLIFRS